MKKILVPVDFSDTSLVALRYAVQLFAASEAKITVLHTYIAREKVGLKPIDRLLEKVATDDMEAFIKKFKEEAPHLNLVEMVVKGTPIPTIVDISDRVNYDLVVMGTKGASGLKEVFVGSVAGGVISKIKAPVLIIPENYKYHPPKNIVFAITGIPLSAPSVVEPLKKIAQTHASNIKVLHITSNKSPDLWEVLDTIQDLDYKVDYQKSDEDINQQINEYLTQNHSNLLCLIRRKRGFFDRIFSKSVTRKQTFYSPVPILILQN